MPKPRRRRTPDKKVHFSDSAEFSAFWLLEQDLRTSAKFDALIGKEGLLGVQNSTELSVREHEIRTATDNWSGAKIAWPDDFPIARVALSQTDFAPDYLDIGPDQFCSHRLRDVLALPHNVIQFLAIDLIAGGDKIRSQNYRKMRVLAQQPALNLERCGCAIKKVMSAMTGESIALIDTLERLVLLKGLKAKSDLFLIGESPHRTLVTDTLAARVLQSGCTDMEFRDPANNQWALGNYIERYRTKTGIAERRVGFLD